MASRVKLNRAGVRQLLRGPEMVADMERRAERVADAAGPGHRVDAAPGRNRARAVVITESWEARWAEATTRALTRALRAAR